MKNRVIYVGSQYLGHLPDDGETMKNSLMRDAIAPYVDQIIPIDLRRRPARLYYLAKYVFCLLFFRKAKVIISASVYVANKMLKVCHRLGKHNGIVYWVVGGLFDKLIASGDLNVKEYEDLDMIIVQGDTLADNLRRAGLKKVITVPNSKHIPDIVRPRRDTNRATRFVFMSRVTREKGVELIIEAVSALEKEGIDVSVDFYGRLDDDYKDQFNSLLRSHKSLKYLGVLDMTVPEGYVTLARYDIMLFPSFHPGEGFPGIAIDAFISGLPLVASDWHENAKVIKDGVTGIIIPNQDLKTLTNVMKNAHEGKYNLIKMSENAWKKRNDYDIANVINKELLLNIGIANA